MKHKEPVAELKQRSRLGKCNSATSREIQPLNWRETPEMKKVRNESIWVLTEIREWRVWFFCFLGFRLELTKLFTKGKFKSILIYYYYYCNEAALGKILKDEFTYSFEVEWSLSSGSSSPRVEVSSGKILSLVWVRERDVWMCAWTGECGTCSVERSERSIRLGQCYVSAGPRSHVGCCGGR